MAPPAGDNSPRRRRPHKNLTLDHGDDNDDDDDDKPVVVVSRRKHKTSGNKTSTSSSSSESNEPPFIILVLQVGTILALLCLVCYATLRYWGWITPTANNGHAEFVDDDDDDSMRSTTYQQQDAAPPDAGRQGHLSAANEALLEAAAAAAVAEELRKQQQQQQATTTIPPLPVWNLTAVADYDAFALSESLAHSEATADLQLFWTAAAGLRADFQETYGGENAARAILERGMTAFFSSTTTTTTTPSKQQQRQYYYPMEQTACRILQAKQEQRSFRFAFGGYSVTAGRGNFFSQSYPFVMEKRLHTVFHLLGIDLHVRNAAIGACPSFPYGWCVANFWGSQQADVVSWDYSMNEAGGDPLGLEAYIRHVTQLSTSATRLNQSPILIVKDTHMATQRKQLIRDYARQGVLTDPIVLHTDPAAQPFLDRREEHRPEGFREWRKFGAPPEAPGQALHHPAVKEHSFIAWILTMHFLSALELLAAAEAQQYKLNCSDDDDNKDSSSTGVLPPPFTLEARNSTKPWKSLLYGEEDESTGMWRMNPVHCRTTFDPIVSGELSEIVVSGSTAEDIDVMLPKSKMFYNRGWVLDLGDAEKKAKRQLDRFGGLGFLDSKKAYYALPTSHTLRLLLPFVVDEDDSSSGRTTSDDKHLPKIGDTATDWFKSVVWCEVNEKRDLGACNTEMDVNFHVGGVNVTENIMMDAAGTLYIGKKLCVYLPVPEGAKLTNRQTLQQNETASDIILPPDLVDSAKEEQVGLVVEAKVINQHIIKRENACSVSHVVWEQVLKMK